MPAARRVNTTSSTSLSIVDVSFVDLVREAARREDALAIGPEGKLHARLEAPPRYPPPLFAPARVHVWKVALTCSFARPWLRLHRSTESRWQGALVRVSQPMVEW